MMRLNGWGRCLIAAVCGITAGTGGSDAQEHPGPVNLGRLSIASVFGENPRHNARLACVRNLFDAGQGVADGAAHVSCPVFDFGITVRFKSPVTVSEVAVVITRSEAAKLEPRALPSFWLAIPGEGTQKYFNSPPVKMTGLRTVYALPDPKERAVTTVWISFLPGADIEAIEILGPPPGNVDLTPMTPAEDAELLGQTNGNAEAGTAESASIAQAGRAQLDKMRTLRATIDRATERSRQAQAWMQLNTSAERLAEILGLDETQKSLADESGTLGVTVDWCEPSGSWTPGIQGYEQYLKLWPHGPKADEAWLKARVGSPCGDSEGTAEEYRVDIAQLAAFLKAFPKSKHAPEIRKQLNASRDGLEQQLKFEREQSAR